MRTFGFTILELLVVIAILLIVSLFSFVAIREYALYQQMQSAEQTLTALFRETRQKTIAAETETNFGLHFASSTVIRFEGASTTTAPEENVVIEIPHVVITTMFSDGSNAVRFARLSGRPSATGTIAISGIQTDRVRQLYITDTGLLLPDN